MALPLALPEHGAQLAEGELRQRPEPGQRIMVVKEPGLSLILSGRKTMEVRGRCCGTGFVWLGFGGKLYGCATISDVQVLTVAEFRHRAAEHMWPAGEEPPYARLCGLSLTEVHALPAPVAYWLPSHARGWQQIFRSSPDDCPRKSRKRGGPEADSDLVDKVGDEEIGSTVTTEE